MRVSYLTQQPSVPNSKEPAFGPHGPTCKAAGSLGHQATSSRPPHSSGQLPSQLDRMCVDNGTDAAEV